MYIHPQVTIRYWVALAITKVYPFLFFLNAAAFILLTLTFRSRHGSFSSASWHLAAGSRYHTPVRKHPATENRWCCVSEGRFRDMWCHCGVCVFLGNLRMSWFCRILTLCSGTKKNVFLSSETLEEILYVGWVFPSLGRPTIRECSSDSMGKSWCDYKPSHKACWFLAWVYIPRCILWFTATFFMVRFMRVYIYR